MPLPEYTPCMSCHDSSDQNELELISQYFKQGYNNLEILEFLKIHGVTISLSTLKRRLRSLGLSRRDTASDHELNDAIEKELGKSGCFVGYRKMWARLRRKGVGPTNKNPEVIAKYYLEAVKQSGGVPRKIRSDDGTENSVIEAIHTYLRSAHNDENAGMGCFAFGRSTANQRIEAYWSQLTFCFMQILRDELYQVAEIWNHHHIASSKFGNSSGPRGRPDCMYFLPHLYNTEDYKVNVDRHEVEEFIDNSTMCPADFSEEFEEFAITIMNELGLHSPQDVDEGLDL
ncbi:unnamed protein product, partial [Porites lobata]